jgi:hypothetical protein
LIHLLVKGALPEYFYYHAWGIKEEKQKTLWISSEREPTTFLKAVGTQ